MVYKQIRTRKIYEEVADELLDMIKRGDLSPGAKLDSVEQLAENFNVGRSAIREALSALRAMGILKMHQGEGTYIREFDPKTLSSSVLTAVLMNKKDVKDLLQVRKILEKGSVSLAAEHATEADLKPIFAALEAMKHANGDEELGEKADLDFHMAIVRASENRFLVDLMDSVSETMVAAMRETRRVWLYSKETTLDRLYEEHRQIYEAIKQGQPDEAETLMMSHLTEVENILLKYLPNAANTV
ncbi:FadR/GntR family transcriptional regulator [Tuberibacillus sp. Marseille-P3662]|uniref:FadR/GntR family transcriptional regulator n=1 Tax=Tuberibacillus sp. Marseille-P3662 TaxID=1965358 RepID=UPI000A1CD09E|nr:FadR/GntR family transcriptional regulator [Tuberibacillus sp. Marseille-P3662]